MPTSKTSGSAANFAASRKEENYVDMAATHIFLPLTFETFGPIFSKALALIKELGRRLTFVTDDKRETGFLLQILCVAIQRYNAVCFVSVPFSATCISVLSMY